ncbi:Rieske (2Fe-2S) protein [Emcibacter sp.]|uniref:Rieske (2Fe-2S) protein n=1 Tax=Emcibacter sp. TaxID=1979954 RepID=UPI003A8F01EB
MTGGGWIEAGHTAEMEKARRLVFRHEGKQILILKRGERYFAVNNRCPHQGYPLSEGTLSEDCTLTCNWHNWKFDLDSGDTVVGGDKLRSYPVKLAAGSIFVNLAEPDRGKSQAEALDNLHACFHRYEYDRMGRELARFKAAGGNYAQAVGEMIRRCYVNFEYGMTHAFAAAADWLTLTERYEAEGRDDAALVTVLEAVSHFAWDSQRYGEFAYTDKIISFDEQDFLEAVEVEDEEVAIALINGALEQGSTYAELRPVLARAALAHYNDFGHSVIYVVKAGQLLEQVGGNCREAVLKSLVRSLVYARREDLVPEFRAYAGNLENWRNTGDQRVDMDSLWGKPVNKILAAVSSSDLPEVELFKRLFEILVRNMLHFDTALAARTDNKITDNVDWLDFTHGITFSNAVRQLCEETPDLWPQGLLQMACFAGRNVSYLDQNLDIEPWKVFDGEIFLEDTHNFLLNHGVPEPIVSCHILKTLMALEAEMGAFPGAAWREEGLGAFNRFLAIPVRRRHSLRAARQSLAFTARE